MTKKFLSLFLSSCILLGSIAWSLYHYEKTKKLAEYKDESLQHLETCDRIISNEIMSAIYDLFYVADVLQQSINSYPIDFNNINNDITVNHLISYFNIRGTYSQIRWIDAQGRERLKIFSENGSANVLPDHLLQDKSNRYYVKQMLNRKRGSIYISPLDLNIENGRIEIPYLPMIRFVTPVVDQESQNRGMAVLNYKGLRLLNIFKHTHETEVWGKPYLLNKDGYYLFSKKKEECWGFMFDAKTKNTFAVDYPSVWNQILKKRAGVFNKNGRIFIYHTIYPLKKLIDNKQINSLLTRKDNADYRWIAVVTLTPDDVSSLLSPVTTRYKFLSLFMFIFSGITIFFITRWIISRDKELQLKRDYNQLKDGMLSAALLISGNLDKRQNIKETLKAAKRLSGAKFAALPILENGVITEIHTEGMTTIEADSLSEFCTSDSICKNFFESSQTMLISDVTKNPQAKNILLESLLQHTLLTTPVKFGNRTLGYLCLIDKEDGGSFTGTEREIIENLASHVGVTYNNAELYDKIRKLNRELEEKVRERTQRLEEALRNVENERQLLFDVMNTTPDLVYFKNMDAVYLGVNKAFQHFAGATFENIINRTDRDIFQPEIAEIRQQKDDRVIKEATTFREEEQFTDNNGNQIIYDTVRTPLRDKNQNLSGVLGISRDITDPKKNAKQLQKLFLAVEHSPSSVVITDIKGTIEYVNPCFLEVTGYSKEEVLGQNPKILKSGNLTGDFYGTMWETILSGKIWKGDFINRKKTGEEYWESSSIAPITDESGNITHFVAIKHDITEQKRKEQELIQAKEEAEVANRTKSDFLANMSHELRTPLNAVIGFSDVLLEQYFGELNEKQLDYVNDIRESGKHLLDVINDILDLSKVESGKMNLHLSMIDISDIVLNSTKMIKEKCLSHSIQLDVDIPDDVKRINLIADQRKLKQVMYNLLSNAVKFTPDGGRIAITVELSEKEICIHVADNGLGLNPEDHEKIFEEFYQAGKGATQKTEGTGLGLALSKSFIELHGGTISAESEGIGKGSRLNISLPLTDNDLMKHLELLIRLNKQKNQSLSICRIGLHPYFSDEDFKITSRICYDQKRECDHLFFENDKQRIYLVLPETNQSGAHVLCERLKQKINQDIPEVRIQCSIAMYPDNGDTCESLMVFLEKQDGSQ